MVDFSTIIRETLDNKKAVDSEKSFDADDKIVTIDNKESYVAPPLDKYEELKQKPYTVDYFKIKFWDQLNPEIDVNKVGEKVKYIEKWVNSEIQRKGMNNTVDSYNELMAQMEQTLSLGNNEKVERKLGRLHEYLKVLGKQRKVEDMRRRLLDGKLSD